MYRGCDGVELTTTRPHSGRGQALDDWRNGPNRFFAQELVPQERAGELHDFDPICPRISTYIAEALSPVQHFVKDPPGRISMRQLRDHCMPYGYRVCP